MQTQMVTRASKYALDYYYAVSRGYTPLPSLADGTEQFANGAVPGAMPFSAIGERVTAGAVLNGMIWQNGAVYIPPAIGVQPSVVSTSINDTLAGTGLQIIDVHYLDDALVPKVESVSMTGAVPAAMTATNVRWVQGLHARQAGSGGAAAGNIAVTFGANNLAYMALGDLKSRSSMLMVPKGKAAFVVAAVAGASSGSAAAQVHVEFVATQEYEHQFAQQGLFFPKTEVALQDGSSPMPFVMPYKYGEGTIIGMMFTTDKAVTVTATYFGWLEDA